MSQSSQYRFNPKLKLLLIAGFIVVLIATAKFFNLQSLLQATFLWVEGLGALAPITFIVIYNLATVLFIPGSLLTLKGGCLFGAIWGSVYVSIAATLGAVWAFLIGRYLSREWVRNKIKDNPKFAAINEAVKKEGWKIVLLTRLSPIFPFNLLNYAFGVTSVSLRDYVIGSLGMIPATVLYVYIGSLASDLAAFDLSDQPATQATQILQWVLRGIGLMATIAVTVYVARLAKKALDQSVVIEKTTHAHPRNR
ncbi:MAG: TVP38/TMEM64 family protein [Cyanobacteriota bacterium]|nr:TVP38/TMEM64 family protein [Cyanobacteriota bacterium]